jgi:hypothetical protein
LAGKALWRLVLPQGLDYVNTGNGAVILDKGVSLTMPK